MNDNKAVDFAAAHEALGLIEVLDREGNPTGQYVPAEQAEEIEFFVAGDQKDHSVTVH